MLAAALWLAAATADDIARAHQLLEGLECDQALALGRAIAADPAANEAEVREGRLVAGYCLAADGRISDAEQQFRAAVLEDVRVEAGFPMEHRVQYLLDAARAQVVLERAQRAAAERAALAAQVEVIVDAPARIVGGERASFVVYVAGPAAARIQSVKLQFRRPTDPEYYSLPVRRGRDGGWRGEIGGVYTGSTRAYALQWFVSASDEQGELQSHGSRVAPFRLEVAAGSNVAADLHARERLPPLTRLLIASVGAPASVVTAATFNLLAAAVLGSMSGVVRDEDLGLVALITWAAVPATMAGAEAATTLFLLENDVAFWPAVAVAATGVLVDVVTLALLGLGGGPTMVPLTVPQLGPWLQSGNAVLLGAPVAVTALVGAVVPASMILWETSQYVE